MMSKQNVPELRFPEFSGEWEEKFIDNDFIIIDGDRGKNYPKEEDFLNDGYCLFLNAKNITKNGLNYDNLQFISKEKHSQLSKGSVKSGDVVITTRGTVGNVSYFNTLSPFEAIRINSGMLILRNPNVNDFYVSLFKSKVFKKFLKQITYQSAQPHITVSTLKKMKYFAPKITNEQKKIGVFLSKLDRLIELEEKKLELLEEQKKGYMQKIFSQELRFKAENGNDYPEWQEKKLKDLGEYKKSYSYSRSYEGEGYYKHIHYGDIHTKLPLVMNDAKKLPSINVSKDLETINKGDIIIADASEDYKDLGKAIVFMSDCSNVVSGLHTIRFRPIEQLSPQFFSYYTQTSIYRQFVSRMGTGVSVLGLSKTSLNKMYIKVPLLKEQKDIVLFLQKFDRLAGLKEQKIVKLKERKRELLRKLFI